MGSWRSIVNRGERGAARNSFFVLVNLMPEHQSENFRSLPVLSLAQLAQEGPAGAASAFKVIRDPYWRSCRAWLHVRRRPLPRVC